MLKIAMDKLIKKMTGSQHFTTSWLGLGFAETPITASKRVR
jgi:hypothetical protein